MSNILPKDKWTCALIQLNPKPLKMEQNFERAADFIRQAAKAGADLAVLPEYCLSAPIWEEQDVPKWTDADFRYVKRFQDLARECQINIVPGTIVEQEPGDGCVLSNRCYFIDRQGTILGNYVKKNLWHPERDFLTGGELNHQVIDSPELGKIGLLVCWDLAFPEAFRLLLAQGARTFIIPTFWTYADSGPVGLAQNPIGELIFLDSMLPARAYENSSAIVFVNAAGGGAALKSFIGRSQACMPFHGAIAKIEHAEEDMVITEIDMTVLDDAEEVYRVRKDVLSDEYHYQVKF